MSSSHTEPSSSSNNSTDFFRQLSRQKEATPQPIRKSTRIVTGLLIGAVLGLVYGFITQTLNSIAMPGVPLALYPFGPVGNVIASIVVWTIVGGLCALPESAISGVAAGCLAMAGVVALRIWTTLPPAENAFFQALTTAGNLLAFFVVILISIPLMLLVRWAIEVQGELALEPLWSWRRLRAPLAALLLLGVVTGVFTLYSEDVRQSMTAMHQLIEQGLAASQGNELPAALKSDRVEGFLANATRSYTLEQNLGPSVRNDISSVYEIDARPVIVARFANGWLLACLIYVQTDSARCKSYTTLPE